MLYGKKTILRALVRGDLPQLVQWMNDLDVTKWLGPRFPISIEQQEDWYNKLIQDKTKKKLIIENKSGKAIGLISLMDIDWQNRQAEFGIYIGDLNDRGQGYGFDATNTLLQFSFGDLGLHRIYLFVFEENERAIQSFKHSGLKAEGTLRESIFYGGQFHNMLVMSILSNEFFGDRS